MRALVITASRHGSTHGIADAIAGELRAQEIEVDQKMIGDPVSLDEYDVIVLGSAVYIGHWMPEAMRFLEDKRIQLRDRIVFLFSSGPLGNGDAKGAIDEHLVTKLMAETGARDHRIFAGSLQPSELGLKEKLVTKVVHAPTGDFRDWEEIREWARGIAQTLVAA